MCNHISSLVKYINISHKNSLNILWCCLLPTPQAPNCPSLYVITLSESSKPPFPASPCHWGPRFTVLCPLQGTGMLMKLELGAEQGDMGSVIQRLMQSRKPRGRRRWLLNKGCTRGTKRRKNCRDDSNPWAPTGTRNYFNRLERPPSHSGFSDFSSTQRLQNIDEPSPGLYTSGVLFVLGLLYMAEVCLCSGFQLACSHLLERRDQRLCYLGQGVSWFLYFYHG